LIIERSVENDGNIKPEIYNLLKNLPEEVLHHRSYGYLHPLGIYNRSLSRVTKAFCNVITELKKLKKDIGLLDVHSKEFVKLESSNLLKSQNELLHSLQSHIDDCYHILKATSPYPNMDAIKSSDKKRMNRSPYLWLYYSKHPTFLIFKDNIQEYKSFVDLIVNKLKHEHARLRDVILANNFETRIGYFVEVSEVDGEEEVVLGPDPEIHPNSTVFSYSRDLSFHFYNLYELSRHLKNALIKAFEQYNFVLTDDFYFKEASTDINDIAKELYELNLLFFPSEYIKPVPIIEWDRDTLFLSLDKEFRLNSDFFGSIRKLVSWTPDGTTKSFRFPRG
jgi:hypothetical protein